MSRNMEFITGIGRVSAIKRYRVIIQLSTSLTWTRETKPGLVPIKGKVNASGL